MKSYSGISIFFALLVNYCLANLPSDITLCKAADSDCIAKVTTEILKSSPNGRPEFGLQKIDPFKITSLVVNQGTTGPINLDLSFHDVELEGFSSLVIKNVVGFEKDPKTSKFEMYADSPKFRLKGKYKANGRILVLPIQGDGDADIILENTKTSIKIKPTVIEKDGKQYLDINKLKLLLEPSKLTIKLDNLFNGDRTLGDNMNAFLNENWNDVWNELSPAINTAFAEVVKNLIKPIFKDLAYDDIYSS